MVDDKIRQFKEKFFGDKYENIKEAMKQDILMKQLVNDRYGQCKRDYNDYINLYLTILSQREIRQFKKKLRHDTNTIN